MEACRDARQPIDYHVAMDNASPPRRSFWRFSLRELILLTLVIAAFLGWGQSLYQRFKPAEASPLMRSFELASDIAYVRRQLGETGPDFSRLSMSGPGSVGSSQQLTAECDVLIGSDDLSKFRNELQNRLIEKVRENDCEPGDSVGNPHEFRINYHRDVLAGCLRVYCKRTDPQHAWLLVIVEEHRN